MERRHLPFDVNRAYAEGTMEEDKATWSRTISWGLVFSIGLHVLLAAVLMDHTAEALSTPEPEAVEVELVPPSEAPKPSAPQAQPPEVIPPEEKKPETPPEEKPDQPGQQTVAKPEEEAEQPPEEPAKATSQQEEQKQEEAKAPEPDPETSSQEEKPAQDKPVEEEAAQTPPPQGSEETSQGQQVFKPVFQFGETDMAGSELSDGDAAQAIAGAQDSGGAEDGNAGEADEGSFEGDAEQPDQAAAGGDGAAGAGGKGETGEGAANPDADPATELTDLQPAQDETFQGDEAGAPPAAETDEVVEAGAEDPVADQTDEQAEEQADDPVEDTRDTPLGDEPAAADDTPDILTSGMSSELVTKLARAMPAAKPEVPKNTPVRRAQPENQRDQQGGWQPQASSPQVFGRQTTGLPGSDLAGGAGAFGNGQGGQGAARGGSGADGKPPLARARELYSSQILGNSRTQTAMRGMPGRQRLNLLCMTELEAQLRAFDTGRPPEMLPSFRPGPGNVLEPARAAYRSRGVWYDLGFRCETDQGITKVQNFSFRVGPPIPRSQLSERGLPSY